MMSVVLVVSTSPDNVRTNPRTLGLCAGVDKDGAVFVRGNGTVMDDRHVVTSSAIAEWLCDLRRAQWHVVIGSKRRVLTLEILIPLIEGTGLLLFRPEEDLSIEVNMLPVHEDEETKWFVCGFPFGSTDVGCCAFPVACAVLSPCTSHFTMHLCGTLCEGLEGAPVVSVSPHNQRICGVLLRSGHSLAWCPGAETPPSMHPDPCLTTTTPPLDSVVGLVGDGGVCASGIVLASTDTMAVVATCAHVARRCPQVRLWSNSSGCIGTGVVAAMSPCTAVDVALLVVQVSSKLVPCLSRPEPDPPRPGEHVATVAYGTEMCTGVVVRWTPATATVTTTCAASPGTSGGALVDCTGRVLGMQCRTLTGRSGTVLSQAQNIHTALALAHDAGLLLHLDSLSS